MCSCEGFTPKRSNRLSSDSDTVTTDCTGLSDRLVVSSLTSLPRPSGDFLPSVVLVAVVVLIAKVFRCCVLFMDSWFSLGLPLAGPWAWMWLIVSLPLSWSSSSSFSSAAAMSTSLQEASLPLPPSTVELEREDDRLCDVSSFADKPF